VGYQTVSPDTIAHYLGIKIGDVYDPEKIRQNFHALWDVGLLENVHIEAEREAGGVTLLVTIEERPIIKDIEFTGNKKLSSSQIRDVLKEGKAEVKVGGPLSLRDIARARAVIAEAYIAQGFRSATVDYKIEDLSKTEKKVIFQIDEGDKVKIASISFTGNEHVSAQTLRNAMHKTKVAVFWRILSDNTVYSQANYEADVESLKGVYQARGYKDVVIKDPILDVYVVNPDAKPNKIKRKVRLTIPIVEGDKFFTNDLTVVAVRQNGQPTESGQTEVFPNQQLVKQFYDLQPGSVLNRDRIVEGLAQIETLYKSRGFIYSYPNPVFKELPDHRVDVEVQIFEGDKFYLGRLEVQGNTMTRDKVIRREFRINEGDAFNALKVKRSQDRLQSLGFFQEKLEVKQTQGSAPDRVILSTDLEERSTGELQLSAGYSSLEKFIVAASIQQRNFMGKGQEVGAGVNWSRYSRSVNLSFTEPYLFDKNVLLGSAVDIMSVAKKAGAQKIAILTAPNAK